MSEAWKEWGGVGKKEEARMMCEDEICRCNFSAVVKGGGGA